MGVPREGGDIRNGSGCSQGSGTVLLFPFRRCSWGGGSAGEMNIGHDVDTSGTSINHILGSFEPIAMICAVSAPGFVHGNRRKVAPIYF
jgi:hypothetical protein